MGGGQSGPPPIFLLKIIVVYVIFIIMIHTNSFNSIYRKYPNQFPKNVINCELGWVKIIEDMCAAIDNYLQYHENMYVDQVVFESIKEKFGVLDISFVGGDEVTDHIIQYCERLSWKTCSVCGDQPATLFCSTKWRSWSHTKTLCEKHAISLFYYRIS